MAQQAHKSNSMQPTTQPLPQVFASYIVLTGASLKFVDNECTIAGTNDKCFATEQDYKNYKDKDVRSARRALKSHRAGSSKTKYTVVPQGFDYTTIVSHRPLREDEQEKYVPYPVLTDELYYSQFPQATQSQSQATMANNNIPPTAAAAKPRGYNNIPPTAAAAKPRGRSRGDSRSPKKDVPGHVDVDDGSTASSTKSGSLGTNSKEVRDKLLAVHDPDKCDFVVYDAVVGLDNDRDAACTISKHTVKGDDGAVCNVKVASLVVPMQPSEVHENSLDTFAELFKDPYGDRGVIITFPTDSEPAMVSI